MKDFREPVKNLLISSYPCGIFLPMKYLMYYLNGFVKKFPLDKSIITIGRGTENNLVIKKNFVSRQHVQINQIGSDGSSISVLDLNSTNGLHLGNNKVKEAVIHLGESFNLGRMEFFLKEGDLEEFEPAPELIPLFNKIDRDNREKYEHSETVDVGNIYDDILKHVLHSGMKQNDFNDFILALSEHLTQLPQFGTLFLLERESKGGERNILFTINGGSRATASLREAVTRNPAILAEQMLYAPLDNGKEHIYTYPVQLGEREAALVYLTPPDQDKRDPLAESFLASLSKLLELLVRLQKPDPKDGASAAGAGKGTRTDIIAANKGMKELLDQAERIAAADIFVLVQGESGTGKELFARFIHSHSNRSGKPFIAINCAAIPENLLESELFGHEKGAFTGAYERKKGKLELASGGTLVLDEVGDMPLPLQAKLLRALQEYEFYRLGGTQPIKVDLRIVSITNLNLRELVKEQKFRKDLYYRLVHRSISIPPLRERKEDISLLINSFTNKFCRASHKSIAGYSVKAFDTLMNHQWPGNVRQLENEIHTMVNLAEDGEMLTYDMLSEEIKEDISEPEALTMRLPARMGKEEEKAFLIQLLEKNNWNKSETARQLNMTYRGLQMKITRMGIQRPEKK